MTVAISKRAPKPAADASAPTKAAAPIKKVKVMLGNGLKRYVLHDGTAVGGKLYEADVEYPVTPAERAALFKLRDENDMRIFFDAEVIREQIRARNNRARRQLAAAGDETARRELEQEQLDRGEIDTGAMALEDSEGNRVGTRDDTSV